MRPLFLSCWWQPSVCDLFWPFLCVCAASQHVWSFLSLEKKILVDPCRTRKKRDVFFWHNGPWAKEEQGGRLLTVVSGASEGGCGRAVSSVSRVYSKASTRGGRCTMEIKGPSAPTSHVLPWCWPLWWVLEWSSWKLCRQCRVHPQTTEEHEAFPNWKSKQASDQSLKGTWPGWKDTR